MKRMFDNPEIFETGGDSPLSPPRRAVLGDNPGGKMRFPDCTFSVSETHSDCWLFCMSSVLGSQLLRECSAEVCVEIREPEAFLKAILYHLGSRNLAEDLVLANCVYRQKTIHYRLDDGVPAPVLKDPRFSHQKEVRGIFVPVR
jgi:hypothetical protein